jgi:hypothetical protein
MYKRQVTIFFAKIYQSQFSSQQVLKIEASRDIIIIVCFRVTQRYQHSTVRNLKAVLYRLKHSKHSSVKNKTSALKNYLLSGENVNLFMRRGIITSVSNTTEDV